MCQSKLRKMTSTKQSVSVKTAIRKGQYFVSYPSIILSTIIFIAGSATTDLEWIKNDELFWLVIGLGFGISYWAITVTKWRIWAFSNVRNIHQLQTKATDCGIITTKGSFLSALEYQTKKDKEVLKLLNQKFKQEDIIEIPKDFPKTTKLFIDKPILIFHMTINLFLFGLICCSLITHPLPYFLNTQ